MIYSLSPADAELFNQVTEWVRNRGWAVEPGTTLEDLPGSTTESYERRRLIITIDARRRVYLEPAGRRKDGTEVVDVFAVPTLAESSLAPKAEH